MTDDTKAVELLAERTAGAASLGMDDLWEFKKLAKAYLALSEKWDAANKYGKTELVEMNERVEAENQRLRAVVEAAKDALDDMDTMFRTTARLKEALEKLEGE